MKIHFARLLEDVTVRTNEIIIYKIIIYKTVAMVENEYYNIVIFNCASCGNTIKEYWHDDVVYNCHKQPVNVYQERLCEDCLNAIAFDETRIAEHMKDTIGDGDPCLRWDCDYYNTLMDEWVSWHKNVNTYHTTPPYECIGCFFRLGEHGEEMNYRWHSIDGKDCHERDAITVTDSLGTYRVCPECRHHHRLSPAKQHELLVKEGFLGYHDCKNLILSDEKDEDGMYKVVGQCNCWSIEHGERERY